MTTIADYEFVGSLHSWAIARDQNPIASALSRDEGERGVCHAGTLIVVILLGPGRRANDEIGVEGV